MESYEMSDTLVKELTVIQNKYGCQFINDLDWNKVSADEQLSEEFIAYFENRVIWSLISERQKLSEEFIEKYWDILDWMMISIHQELSHEFIVTYQKRLWLNIIFRRYKMKINMSNFLSD